VLELLHALYCRLHDWRFISPEINGVPSESDFNKLWVQTWLLVLHSFSRLLDDHRHHDLSSQGFGLLEKALLHPEDCNAAPSHWSQCFRCVRVNCVIIEFSKPRYFVVIVRYAGRSCFLLSTPNSSPAVLKALIIFVSDFLCW
jgi:hypothetical protein